MAKEDIQKDYMGMISWSKLMCGAPQAMFGSNIKTDHPIVLRISPACLSTDIREYNCDKGIYPINHPYIEVMMTPVQWAEFLTSGGSTGVPCTVSRIDKKFTSPVDDTNVAEEFDADFKTAFEKTNDKLKNQENIINDIIASGKQMSKKQMKELADNIKWIRQGYSSDVSYIRTRFTEEMADIVMKAKAEINAYAELRIGDNHVKCLENGEFVKDVDVITPEG